MIQIWNEDSLTTKYAHFSDGVTRFATVANFASADMVRLALLDSTDIRVGIQPRVDSPIVWHDDDKVTIVNYFHSQIDEIKFSTLQKTIFPNGADVASLFQCIVYILKFLELMSAQLGLQSLTDAVILSHEAGENLLNQQQLAATWSSKSDAWLNLVGIAEREASRAKKSVSDCNNAADMRQIVGGFPAVLSGAL